MAEPDAELWTCHKGGCSAPPFRFGCGCNDQADADVQPVRLDNFTPEGERDVVRHP